MSAEFWYFIGGVVATMVVAIFVYWLQKNESVSSQDSFSLFLYQIWKKSDDQQSNIRLVDQSLAAGFESQGESLETITRQINEIKTLLIQQYHDSPKSVDLALVKQYKELGDAWSDAVSKSQSFRVLTPDGRIFIESILTLHKAIFPGDFPWVGRLREANVTIADSFGPSTRIIDATMATTQIHTIDPKRITTNLNKLCRDWNTKIQLIRNYDIDAKLEEIAYFHHEFEIIHPFLDGNGRVGRIILSDQVMFLSDKRVALTFPGNEYFAALRKANSGDISALRMLIKQQMIS
jgi:Fic family protein